MQYSNQFYIKGLIVAMRKGQNKKGWQWMILQIATSRYKVSTMLYSPVIEKFLAENPHTDVPIEVSGYMRTAYTPAHGYNTILVVTDFRLYPPERITDEQKEELRPHSDTKHTISEIYRP